MRLNQLLPFAALCLVILALCVVRFRSACEELRRSNSTTKLCVKLGNEIQDARENSSVATTNPDSEDKVLARVTEAAESAGFSTQKVLGVSPADPIRNGQSDYLTRNTRVSLSAIPLKACVKFAETLSNRDGFEVASVVLIPPAKVTKPEKWSAELTLTQLIYEPINRTSQGSSNSK